MLGLDKKGGRCDGEGGRQDLDLPVSQGIIDSLFASRKKTWLLASYFGSADNPYFSSGLSQENSP